MRSLSGTLTATIAARNRRPSVTASAVRRLGGVAMLQWTQLGQGSEAPGPAALAQLSNGNIVRGRLDLPYARFWVQAIASPGASSAWTAWPTLLATSVTAIALWAQGTTAYAAWVTTGNAIQFSESTDGGTTWSAAATIATATAAPAAIAGATKTGGKTVLAWDEGAALKYAVRAAGGGAWGAATTGLTLGGSCTGLAAHYSGDFNFLATGADAAGDKRLRLAIYGDNASVAADTWDEADTIALSSSGSPVSYHDPALAFADVYRFFYREAYSGKPPGSRPYWSHYQSGQNIIDGLWKEPTPFDSTSPYGPALAYATGSYVYLATYNTVWRAALSPTALDLTAAIRRLGVDLGLFSGSAELTLGNDAGTYSTLGSGAVAQLTLGSELTLSLGYRTTAGDEVSELPHFYVTAAEYRADRKNRADLILTARDAWWLLSRWTARRSFSWATGEANVFQLLSFVFARAGLPFTTSGASADLADLSPAFTISPGDTGLAAVTRLLALVPDYLRMRPSGGVAGAIASSDASQFSWGGTYPILSGRYRQELRHFNHLQLHGRDVLGEAFDFAEIEQAGGRIHQIHDRNVDSTALASSRATGYLRDETVQQRADQIVVPVHPGLEVLDPVDVTDGRAGLAGAGRRVLGLTVTHDPSAGRYDQTITLGGL